MSEKPGEDQVTFEEFRRMIAQALQVEEGKVTPEASFVEDLIADSLQLVQLMLRMEEMGIGIPIERAWEVVTVGDAYELYKSKAAPETEV